MKLNLENNKTNLIVTAIVMAVILAFGIITGISFVKFYNYDTEFVVRPDVIDDIQKLSDYSPSLKDTVGDADIFIINGTQNTVAVVKSEKQQNFKTEESLQGKTIVAHQAQIAVADSQAFNIDASTIPTVESAEEALQQVKDGSADVALVSYADAKAEAKKEGSPLAIADVVVERTPSMLLLGGTHPNEPSGQMTATFFMENATVKRGKLYIITEINRSAYTHSMPLEGAPQYYTLTTAGNTERKFKFGARMTNMTTQYPTPDVYQHSSGQLLSAGEARNLNRSYPGSVDGTYTERVAWAVTNLINTNNITIEIDFHEASPHYITNNAVVYHQDAGEVLAKARLFGFRYEMDGKKNIKLDIKDEASPTIMSGLTHREIGDYTNAYAFLFETSHAEEGLFHGPFVEEMIHYEDYKDKYAEYLWHLEETLGKETGVGYCYGKVTSLSNRVARHALSTESIVKGYNKVKQARSSYTHSELPESQRNNDESKLYLGQLLLGELPSYEDIVTNGVGYYLLDSQR